MKFSDLSGSQNLYFYLDCILHIEKLENAQLHLFKAYLSVFYLPAMQVKS